MEENFNEEKSENDNKFMQYEEYRKAAENGNKSAMNNLALCYKNGKGTEKDLEKTFYWFQKAAKGDHINAQYNLALSYYNGEGTEKNLEKAFYWCQKAAENGN